MEAEPVLANPGPETNLKKLAAFEEARTLVGLNKSNAY